MTDPSDEKAKPQIQPDKPPKPEDSGSENTGSENTGSKTQIEDPELRSGQYGPGADQA